MGRKSLCTDSWCDRCYSSRGRQPLRPHGRKDLRPPHEVRADLNAEEQLLDPEG